MLAVVDEEMAFKRVRLNQGIDLCTGGVFESV